MIDDQENYQVSQEWALQLAFMVFGVIAKRVIFLDKNRPVYRVLPEDPGLFEPGRYVDMREYERPDPERIELKKVVDLINMEYTYLGYGSRTGALVVAHTYRVHDIEVPYRYGRAV